MKSHIAALEDYFCRSLSLTLLTLGLVTLVLTGSLPLTSSLPESKLPFPFPLFTQANVRIRCLASASQSHPLALPILIITTAFHAGTAFYAYMQYTTTSQFAFALSCTGSGMLAAMGVWCLLFGGSAGGTKERVSGWPFRNEEVERRKREKREKWEKKY